MSEDDFSELILRRVVELDSVQYEQLLGTLYEHFRYNEENKAVAWRLKQAHQLLHEKNKKWGLLTLKLNQMNATLDNFG